MTIYAERNEQAFQYCTTYTVGVGKVQVLEICTVGSGGLLVPDSSLYVKTKFLSIERALA